MSKTTHNPLGFDPEARYVTSYLLSPAVLGFIRLLLGTYSLVTNLVVLISPSVQSRGSPGGQSEGAGSYFSYFTHLSHVGLTAWLWAAGVQTIAFARTAKAGGDARYPLQSWPKVLRHLHEFLFATIATFRESFDRVWRADTQLSPLAFIVTVVYWSLLSGSNSFSTPFNAWSNISQHILNSTFVLFELIFTNLPTTRWIYLAGNIVILALYLGVAYITHATQGFYPYSFLDPIKQGALLAAYIIGIAVGEIIFFVIVRYAILLRIRLVGRRDDAITHDCEKMV